MENSVVLSLRPGTPWVIREVLKPLGNLRPPRHGEKLLFVCGDPPQVQVRITGIASRAIQALSRSGPSDSFESRWRPSFESVAEDIIDKLLPLTRSYTATEENLETTELLLQETRLFLQYIKPWKLLDKKFTDSIEAYLRESEKEFSRAESELIQKAQEEARSLVKSLGPVEGYDDYQDDTYIARELGL